MMDLTYKNLKQCFTNGINNDAEFVGVLIEMEGFDDPEVIINHRVNIADKLDYYGKTYDENLNHKFAKGIRIVGFTYGDSFADIQNDLVGE
ncbi:hypothetical protein [Bacillus wiedmannii]|uniref:hypothetical protein n=1 Tax=Bacillus wiedmannii TaxID=1890302 RepID=UPI003F650925